MTSMELRATSAAKAHLLPVATIDTDGRLAMMKGDGEANDHVDEVTS